MSTIAEILMAQGRQASNARRQQANGWAPLIQQLANLPAQVMNDRAVDRAAQEAAFDRSQQRDARGQQLAAGQREQDAATRGDEDEQAMTAIFASPGILDDSGSVDIRKAVSMAQQQAPRLVPGLMEAAQKHDEGVQQAALRAAQAAAAERSNQPAAAAPYTLNPGDRRFGSDNTEVASVPAAEKPEEEVSMVIKGPNGRPTRVMVPKSQLRQGGVEEYREPTSGASRDPGPLETIIGADGKPIRVRREDAIGKAPASGTEKASSGVQKRVLNFFNRAEQADKDLEALEPEIQKQNLSGQAWQAMAPNFAQTQLGQSYIAAQRQFTEARLRKDSGAAIPPHEFASDRETYFVQPGDSKKTIQDKNRARATMLASLAFESGQALGEFLGDSDEARKTVERYRSRSARQPPSEGATRPISDPGYPAGAEQTFRGGQWIRTK